jgi:Protein of unknown function (DUF3429)
VSYIEKPRSIPRAAFALGLGCTTLCVLLAFSQWTVLPFLSAELGLRAAAAFGAVTLSFAAGIRWGLVVKGEPDARHSSELIASVLAALVGWSALLLSPLIGLILLIAGLLLQALWDILSVEQGRLPQWFGNLRMLLTIGVVLPLFSMLGKLVVS